MAPPDIKPPAVSKPEEIINDEIRGLGATGSQICVYRCMDREEAEQIGIDFLGFQARRPDELQMQNLKGHLGHVDQAEKKYCATDRPPKVLTEFLLKPNAHDLLFSPKVAAIGTKSHATAMIAETAEQKNQGKYVVKESGEGYVKGYIGIKSEKNYLSLAMQGKQSNNGQVRDNPSKRLLSKLTQLVRAIEPGTEASCLKVLDY